MEFRTFTVSWDERDRPGHWVATVSGERHVGWGAISDLIEQGGWQVLAVVPEVHSASAMGTEQWVDRYRLFLQRSRVAAAPLPSQEPRMAVLPPLAVG